jgi:hypothetical protein
MMKGHILSVTVSEYKCSNPAGAAHLLVKPVSYGKVWFRAAVNAHQNQTYVGFLVLTALLMMSIIF